MIQSIFIETPHYKMYSILKLLKSSKNFDKKEFLENKDAYEETVIKIIESYTHRFEMYLKIIF